MTDHTDLVTATKTRLDAQGLDLSGPCGAFAITSRVAWALHEEGAGLLDKPTGNNCRGYAVDIIAYRNGQIIDCLGDAGGDNRPGWLDGGLVDPARWRPPFPPPDEPIPTSPAPPDEIDWFAVAAALTRAAGGLLDAANVLQHATKE